MDVVDSATRSRMMAGIKGANTIPEVVIRKALHRMGFRYRLHVRELPGRPDIVLPRYRAVIFVHGCFWHKHDCHLFKWPSTREDFWKRKLIANEVRDRAMAQALQANGWRACIVWECALKSSPQTALNTIATTIQHWLLCRQDDMEIPEHQPLYMAAKDTQV